MAITKTYFSFKDLLATVPRGEPLSMAQLAQKGLTPTHAGYLVKHSWLLHLGHNAYMLPGDNLSLEGCLGYLSARIPGLHVGGRTALSWRGIRHNLAFRETTELWGTVQARIPNWLTERFPCRYQVTKIFDDALPEGLGISALPNGRPDVAVSGPERALLEVLSDVGRFGTLEDASNLLESARHLREPLLDELLAHVTRIKVIRLAYVLSEKLELSWAPLARKNSDRLGGAKRWVAVSKTGERLVLKRS